jgi:hypothetical protein
MSWLDLLKDVPLTAVVKERLAHEEKLHEETQARNAELQVQVDELSREVAALRRELATLRVPEDFMPHDGVLWKKAAAGGYEDTPYCRICKMQMTPMMAGVYYCVELAFHRCRRYCWFCRRVDGG